jgi:hypothetical protein
MSRMKTAQALQLSLHFLKLDAERFPSKLFLIALSSVRLLVSRQMLDCNSLMSAM